MLEPISQDNASQHKHIAENSEWKCHEEIDYKVYFSGSYIDSNFIKLYVPNNPYRDKQGKTKAVIYLHGFALCMPKFYEQHLSELVKKGYYVIFPGFQKSDYPENPDSNEDISDKERVKLVDWSEVKKFVRETWQHIAQGRVKSVLEKIAVAAIKLRYFLAIFLIIRLISLTYYFVDRQYGKHLIKLIRTVRYSLFQSPLEWIDNAITTTDNAWQMLCSQDPKLAKSTEFYLFGHSLGGLLALSWIYYLKDKPELQAKFYPRQIIVADPAPNTVLGIPNIVVLVLKLFNSRLTRGEIDIKKTGVDLDVPVAILHGEGDKLVKAKFWYKPGLFNKKSNFDYIATADKKLYFSLSDKSQHLLAFHNQAVTDTNYYSDALFQHFGGVKHEANAYNYEYIWAGLNLVIENQIKASELLENFPLKTIKVATELPSKSFSVKLILITLLILIALFGLIYSYFA